MKVFKGNYLPEEIDDETKKQVIGFVCCVWTEFLVEEDIDSMLFPRILAWAEMMWSYPDKKGFNEFFERVKKEQRKWEGKELYSDHFSQTVKHRFENRIFLSNP